jgi:trans-aconitate 2-methyltransferase
VFQWVPGHLKQLERLLTKLLPGGVLAVQIPDSLNEPAHLLMREVAQLELWRDQLSEKSRVRDELPTPGSYYDALSPLCTRLEIWHTIYYHVLDNAEAIVEWVKGTGLRPFLDLLEPLEVKEFLTEYTARIAAIYRPQANGKVIFRFPRVFVVAVK